jgi:hypothetical protein
MKIMDVAQIHSHRRLGSEVLSFAYSKAPVSQYMIKECAIIQSGTVRVHFFLT